MKFIDIPIAKFGNEKTKIADAGADASHPNAMGYHPLDIAYWQGEFPMGCDTAESECRVSYLSRNGVNPLARSKPKTTAL
ncbi:MAG: hypothetical protein ACRC6S_07680 [Shewanella sp.]